MSQLLTRHQGERTVIRIRLRTGVWEVSRDGAFLGDYLRRTDAINAAHEVAASFQALGGIAEIDLPSAGRPQGRLQ